MFRKVYILLICVVVGVLVVIGCVRLVVPATTVVLVRHAEKVEAGTNPDLTAAGLARADALVAALEDAGVSAIYVTDFCRTAQTAQPLADTLGLPLQVQSIAGTLGGFSDCSPTIDVEVNVLTPDIDSPTELADHVLEKKWNSSVLVVGHSNTVPVFVTAFGAKPLCPDYFPIVGGVCRIPDQPGNAEYNNLFIVRAPRWFGEPTIIRVRYGEDE